MLAPSMVKEIRRLLVEDNFSQRKIARLTGVSRGTIGAIASGRRPDYELRPRAEDEYERPLGPPRRCVSCGGMVYMPCRLCALRRRLALKKGKRRPEPRQEPRRDWYLGLDLRDEHRRRYEMVQAWRIQAERLGNELSEELGSDWGEELVAAGEMR